MESIAIIPARGGSKRIPQKNIRDFCGKPIIAYSIEAALKSNCFDEVMVSTNSEEIACIARRHGASVPFLRSEQNSNDFATTADVIAEVLNEYRSRGKNYDCFACIYATAPFVTAERLKDAMKFANGANAVVPVVRYSFPPQRACVIRDGSLVYLQPQYEQTRIQDLEPVYHDCGQFYLGICNTFREFHTLMPPDTKPYIVPEEEAQDIDTLSDWRIAEFKYKALHNREKEHVSDV